jgi:GGDEF domain-containing protein
MTIPDNPAGPAFRQALTRIFPRNPNANWLNVTAMLADVAFETDAAGRFEAFGQSSILGIPAAELIGRHLSDFCKLTGNTASAANSFSTIFATLSRQSLVWRGVVTLTRADGALGNYQIFLAPKPAQETAPKAHKPSGRGAEMAGAYGLLIDMHAPELQMLTPAAGRVAGMLDPQTGLWSAATFAEETGRRFDRLDVEGLPGTLILLGFGRTPAVGHNAVAARLAQELRDIIRPTDILGRISTTIFGLWCDGMDDLAGAERAARFCQRLPSALPGDPCISIGLVARWPGNMDDPKTLIEQATIALLQADKVAQTAADAGSTEPVTKGTWRVWNPQRT